MVWHPGGLSPFRTGFLAVEIFIDGVWTVVPDSELGDDGVEISRGGRPGTSNAAEPGQLNFRIKDPTGKWSPRHPSSPYFGLIGRGTKIRVRVELVALQSFTRFYGEIVTFSPAWTKKGAPSAFVEVEAAGIFRRLGQGARPLLPSLNRYNNSLIGAGGLLAYWPMDDSSDATSFTNLLDPEKLMTYAGTPSFGAYSGIYGSNPLPTIGTSVLTAYVTPHTAGSAVNFRWFGRVPLATTNGAILTRLYLTTGNISYVDVIYTTGGFFRVAAYRQDNSLIAQDTSTNNRADNPIGVSVELIQNGTAVDLFLRSVEVLTTGGQQSTTSVSLPSSTLGKALSVVVNPAGANLGNVAVGQATVQKVSTGVLTAVYSPTVGNRGESSATRFTRLANENGLSRVFYAPSTLGELLGPQRPAELLELFRELADSDGGMLYEPTDGNDIGLIRGQDLLSQTTPYAKTFAYVENMFSPFVPVEDDADLANVVTVTRDGGSSATVEVTGGALGTDAAGVYEDAKTLSLYRDNQTAEQAHWRAHLGTWDEAKYPEIGVDLADYRLLADPTKQAQLLGVAIGNRLTITGIPSWLPPFDVDQIVTGIKETIRTDSYRITWNCTPARPYRGGHWNASTDRWDGAGTTLFSSVSASATSIVGTLPAGVRWTVVDGSYQILVNGEIMTVTNVTAPSSGRQTFTVTRSVNGVSKAHTAGATISLADPARWTL